MLARPRGVKRPTIPPALADRVPPGQHVATRWPVLHHGDVPPFDPTTWDFRVFGLVEAPLRLTWDEFLALPRVSRAGDLHCVTRWSKLDNAWQGVPARDVVGRAGPRPEARFALFHAEGGYTANLPLAALDDALLALAHDGEPLTPEHGFPLRAVVPSRYAWKGAKWLRAVEFLANDQPGFWESFGYHPNADPWREERFAEDHS